MLTVMLVSCLRTIYSRASCVAVWGNPFALFWSIGPIKLWSWKGLWEFFTSLRSSSWISFVCSLGPCYESITHCFLPKCSRDIILKFIHIHLEWGLVGWEIQSLVYKILRMDFFFSLNQGKKNKCEWAQLFGMTLSQVSYRRGTYFHSL